MSPFVCLLFIAILAVGGAALGLSIYLMSRVTALEDRITNMAAMNANVAISTSASPMPGYGAPLSLLTGSGEWAPGVSMPAARSDLQVVHCDGQVILLGGLSSSNVVMDTVWTFDPTNEVYNTSKATMPSPRYRFGAACLNGRLYAAGGFTNTSAGNAGFSVDTVDVYDVARDSWAAAPSLIQARGDLALAAVDGALHAIGGYDWTYTALSSHEVLDPSAAGGAWTAAAPMPHAKGDLQAATIGSQIYVPGGWNSSHTFLDELAIYDAPSNSWSVGPPMRSPRGDTAVVALHGAVFVIGGESWSGRNSMCDWGWGPEVCAVNLIPMHGVEMYSPQTETWTSMSPLPVSRFRFAACAVDGRESEGALFSFGGHAHGEVAVDSQWNFHRVPEPNLFFHPRVTTATQE